jgi:uncharacterized membrane protein YjgN (DUF898 family)
MDAMTGTVAEKAPASAFTFEGDWREFAPIAFTNLLLSIVTLGIYRFWATTRERDYLWSRSRLIDTPLAWAGTGGELFLGFVMAIFLIGVPAVSLNLVTQGLILQDQPVAAAILFALLVIVLSYFIGVARFRALRYRLSRTHWYGIRGGSDDPGFHYGLSYIWKSFVGMTAAGLLVPWAMCSLWNERWNRMSFGPHAFASNVEAGPLMKRYLLFYALPIVLLIAAVIIGALAAATGQVGVAVGGGMAVVLVLAFYVAIPVVMLIFYAKFYRNALDGLRLDTLQFGFTARSRDWLLLFLGDIAIVIGTLGIGAIFLGYRHWKFFVTHTEIFGEIDLERLTQSATPMARQGEGLLDALDVGAF